MECYCSQIIETTVSGKQGRLRQFINSSVIYQKISKGLVHHPFDTSTLNLAVFCSTIKLFGSWTHYALVIRNIELD